MIHRIVKKRIEKNKMKKVVLNEKYIFPNWKFGIYNIFSLIDHYSNNVTQKKNSQNGNLNSRIIGRKILYVHIRYNAAY